VGFKSDTCGLAKVHFKKRLDKVSSFYIIQFSHVYESSSIFLLLSTTLVFSLSCSSTRKKNFCLGSHFELHINIKAS
jgi:hypothetical protein